MFRSLNKFKLPIAHVARTVKRNSCCPPPCCPSNPCGPKPLCAHHKELVPPFCEITQLKSFELKSDCTTFHMKSCGYDPCCPRPCPCPAPCPGPCPGPCPCPPKCPCPCPCPPRCPCPCPCPPKCPCPPPCPCPEN